MFGINYESEGIYPGGCSPESASYRKSIDITRNLLTSKHSNSEHCPKKLKLLGLAGVIMLIFIAVSNR